MGGKRRASPSWLGLSDAWRQWVLEALAGGADRQTVLAGLREHGVSEGVAARELDTIDGATALFRQRYARLEQRARLLAELESEELERVEHCDADAFYTRYFHPNRAVVLTDPWRGRAPLERFSLAALREQHGDAIVRVARGRNANRDAVVDPRPFSEDMALADVIAAAVDEPERDLYIVSRNFALEGPLAALCDELTALPAPLERDPRRRVSLWLGPAGTHTPLHHDTTNVFFCQMAGRKRVRLVSSLATPVLLGRIDSSFYAAGVPEDVRVHEVVLEPGEALFIPVGWWHEVDALTPSVSLSFTNLRSSNRFEWYRPGDL